MSVHLFRFDDNGDRTLVAIHRTSVGVSAYQFRIIECDTGTVAALSSAAGIGTQTGGIPADVRETLELDNFTVATSETTAADGGQPSLDDIDIAAAFEDIPHIENPTERERSHAALRYPPAAVPDDGPVPDPHHALTPQATVTIPDWVTASILWRLQDGDLTAADVHDAAFDYVQVTPDYVTSSGDPLIDALVTEEDA